MSEKYKMIYSTEKELYTEGSPVVIAEGGLVRDIKNGNTFSQFRLVNISTKTIKSVSGVAVTDCGTGEGRADGLVCVRDMDLTLNIPLDGFDHKELRLEIKGITFTDGSIWVPAEGTVWSALDKPQSLFDYLSDEDLVREFHSHFEEGEYFPLEHKDLWFCTCGSLNHCGEAACHGCNRTLSSFKKYGVTELKNAVAKQKRLDAINRDAFEDAYRSVQADKKSNRNRYMIYMLIAIAVITVIALLIASDGTHYTQAVNTL